MISAMGSLVPPSRFTHQSLSILCSNPNFIVMTSRRIILYILSNFFRTVRSSNVARQLPSSFSLIINIVKINIFFHNYEYQKLSIEKLYKKLVVLRIHQLVSASSHNRTHSKKSFSGKFKFRTLFLGDTLMTWHMPNAYPQVFE